MSSNPSTNTNPTAVLMFRQGDILFKQIKELPKDVQQKLQEKKIVADPLYEVAYGEVSGHKHKFESQLLMMGEQEAQAMSRAEFMENARKLDMSTAGNVKVLKNPGINEVAQYIVIEPSLMQEPAMLSHDEHKTIDFTGQVLEKPVTASQEPIVFEVIREQEYNPFKDLIQTVKD